MKYCFECKHYLFLSGWMGYSSWTPGQDAEERCQKRHWEIHHLEDSAREVLECIQKAETCPDFEAEEVTP